LLLLLLLLQYECSSRNVEILEAATDAKGRKFEIIKVPCPPPMFRTHHEADTVDVSGTAVLSTELLTESVSVAAKH
jgi:agmatine/peptidylarginine deiminase